MPGHNLQGRIIIIRMRKRGTYLDYARQSTAYDLSRYEQHLRPQPPELHVVGRGQFPGGGQRAPSAWGSPAPALAVVSMLAVMLYNKCHPHRTHRGIQTPKAPDMRS